MELVIQIDEAEYNKICNYDGMNVTRMMSTIQNGIVLPKDHGRLIDADALKDKMIGWLKPEKPDEVEMVAIDNIAVSVIMELEESRTILGASAANKSGDQVI